MITHFGIHQGIAGCFSFQHGHAILAHDARQVKIARPGILLQIEIEAKALRRYTRDITVILQPAVDDVGKNRTFSISGTTATMASASKP
ncbi:hypothetical protein HS096_05885 [candidate division WWE3 bacterium]|uniref:Uncharacterized protein n=1 Tax=candidate division WWE3 bacterium TaxID=2053526 RepID=A0A928Y6Q6_UNCKA|nr:hypothetical protein [candidate division WWE3 bacterium]